MSLTPKLIDILQLPAPEAAPLILGQRLTRRLGSGEVSGIITEVEAYQEGDPASHTFNGRTARTQAMFGPPGHAYIYFTYGMHWCFNITAEPDGQGSGILVRAVEIDRGYEAACRHRFGIENTEKLNSYQRTNISNGPGKVAQAFAINKNLYGINLLDPQSELQLAAENTTDRNVIQTPRIGISKAIDVPWRWMFQ